MSGIPRSNYPELRPVSVRARLRSKSQLTLPEEIRRALCVNEGDEIEFRVAEDGTITARGYVSVPADHAWLYTPRQDAQRAAGRDLPDSRVGVYESAEALFVYLEALGAADG